MPDRPPTRAAARHRAHGTREPGALLVRAGAALFLLGVVAVCVTVLPHPLSRQDRPLPLNLLAFFTAAGLGLALLGLLRGARAEHRAHAAARVTAAQPRDTAARDQARDQDPDQR